MGIFSKKHSIGKTIANLRKEKGWTQAELAEKLNVTDKAVSKWEKDAGSPSIEFLPDLAQVFDVTIDYLMTGKESEPKIIHMSKIELCAKNDDVKMLKEVKSSAVDENGKSLMDYVLQYNSLKVLKELFDRCSHQSHYLYFFKLPRNGDIPCDLIIMLAKINREIKYISEVTRAKTIYELVDIEESGYLPLVNYLVENYDDLSEKQKEYYFGKEDLLKPKSAWLAAYPYFLEVALKKDKKKLYKKFLNTIITTNEDYIKGKEELYRWAGSYFDAQFRNWVEWHVFINILRSTVVEVYKNGDKKMAEKLNSYCKNPLTQYDFEVVSINNNKDLSQQEKEVAKCFHYGIVCIDELLKINDFNVIRKTLTDNPISYKESLEDKYKKGSFGDIFKFAVDHNLKGLIMALKSNNKDEIRYEIVKIEDKLNKKHLYYVENNIRKEYEFLRGDAKKIKERILNELAEKNSFVAIKDELNLEYFKKELAKGNIDLIIIKLCVRLEAYLRVLYKTEDDFSILLDKWCSARYSDDHEGYNYDVRTPELLNKLRKSRNNIVHSVKKAEKLTLNEVKECIDIILKLD